MIGATLDNYRILEKIGEGGQGAVYKAVDTRLGRTVVIKVLPPELTVKEANLKRFEREARLASSLDHPNICTIFDLGEAGNVHYIVMQHVEGRNVRQLVNGRPLELKSALLIAIQVADALATAHARGIIHRDVKAGNVMVTDAGQTKVLDFGLAKLLDEDAARSEGIHHTELTEIGVPYGTATYAAPEQARGDRVDKRADIFSTGVLLYEMLTGIWPFQGKTSVDVRHAVLHAQPKPLAEARPDPVPPRLQAILDKALQKEPRDRYQQMEELRDELRELYREVTSGTQEAARFEEGMSTTAPRHLASDSPVSRALRWLRNNITGSVEGPATAPVTQAPATAAQPLIHDTPLTSLGDQEKKSVAILPFKNLSNDEASGFYEFSLADAVITELARLRSLVVRPSSVIIKYQGTERDPRDAGRELNVDAVLSAAFLRAGNRLRVTAQLLDVNSGQLLWSDRIDADSSDIITVQDTIARHIVDGLRLELSKDEKAELAQPATANADAYEEYLRGRDRMGRYIYHTLARADVDAAIEHFKRATELDPSFALAYAGQGGCYANRVMKGFGDAEDYHRAEDAFEKALALDERLLEPRMHMVFIHLSRGEKQKARALVSQLRREIPNDVGVHFVTGVLRRLDGDYDGALRSFERMVRLNPAERVVISYNRARIFMYQRRYDDALLELDQGAALEPDHPLIKTFRARVLFYRGEVDEATRLLEEVLVAQPQLDGIRPIYATCLSAQGRHAEALAQITENVKDSAAADFDIPYWLASVYALEGMRDEALQWLRRAISLGNENRTWFESDPNWAAFHADARFKELMERIPLPSGSRGKRITG
ncbi:MAG: eukaryotic-like serine/threonine-protein kinase [Blastocatellia bacterium]|jgi:serine/threonine-protein kinase|nr:eukaryotic-like serine/threonine-protein kinase [Blastocatellia bacterium]